MQQKLTAKQTADLKAIAASVLPKLVAAHPMVFFPKDSIATKPLAVGIQGALFAAHPEIKKHHIRGFLRVYCNKSRYLRGLLQHEFRIDLQGCNAQPVAEEHRRHALAVLEARQAAITKQARQGYGRNRAAPRAAAANG